MQFQSNRRKFLSSTIGFGAAAVAFPSFSENAKASETPVAGPSRKPRDKVVEVLLEVQEDARVNGNGSGVTRCIAEVLEVIKRYDFQDYGCQVRVLTKAMMIVNEEHRMS